MSIADRVLNVADEPNDDDDRRLRKRVAIAAAYILAIAALQLPVIAQGHPMSLFIAVSMPLVTATNLVILARTRRSDRYVTVLAVTVLALAASTEVALGGLAGSSASIVFAFLAPVLALLGMGPKAATPWFIAFVATLVAVILLDPVVSSHIPPQPYPMRLV
jgi:hypothetical protein